MNLYLKPSIVCKADGSEVIEMQQLSHDYIDTMVETLSVVKDMDLEGVLKVIRMSDDENAAMCKLMDCYSLTEKQARYIINIPIEKAAIVFNPKNVDEYAEWLLQLKQLLQARPQEWSF